MIVVKGTDFGRKSRDSCIPKIRSIRLSFQRSMHWESEKKNVNFQKLNFKNIDFCESPILCYVIRIVLCYVVLCYVTIFFGTLDFSRLGVWDVGEFGTLGPWDFGNNEKIVLYEKWENAGFAKSPQIEEFGKIVKFEEIVHLKES